jgi:hypothetical protein
MHRRHCKLHAKLVRASFTSFGTELVVLLSKRTDTASKHATVFALLARFQALELFTRLLRTPVGLISIRAETACFASNWRVSANTALIPTASAHAIKAGTELASLGFAGAESSLQSTYAFLSGVSASTSFTLACLCFKQEVKRVFW